ncbi:MAG: M23 family metallopeptidase [Agathobaculum sp.]|jgi:murein DD-endopeptidase MepM/ murein hydrolase activator NlpD|uniref:M23 family metallopeptidase n=1 Tax=Agathobaculum sp. TaxID=2048138 RepID=UPI003D8E49AD
MTGKRPARRRGGGGSGGGGGGLLLLVVLVLTAGIFKYADTPFAVSVRQRAAETLTGVPGMDRVLAVIGGGTDESASEVFRPQETGGDDYAISSGGADDILGRELTLFPDTVDQTVYPMEFTHALPAEGTLTSGFGSRLSPTTGQPGFHYGLDIAADEGVKIGAFAAGTVREVGQSSYGNYLIIDHEDGFSTLYAHCSSISAKVGDAVECGDEVALVGQTGNATGPHLHLELWRNGKALDPSSYLTAA